MPTLDVHEWPSLELVLFQLYRLATWATFSALDDPAMMAFAFS